MAQSLLATDGYKFSMAEAGWPLRTETFYYSHRKGGPQMLPVDVPAFLRSLLPRPADDDYRYLTEHSYEMGPGFKAAIVQTDALKIRALPRGAVFYDREPVFTVTGPSALVSWLEPLVLMLHYRIQVASRAGEVRVVTCERQREIVRDTLDAVGLPAPAIEVDSDGYYRRVLAAAKALVEAVKNPDRIFEVGMRSASCLEQHEIALRACREAGIQRTSNVLLARTLGMIPVGTMGHEHVQRFGADEPAFRAMRERRPGRSSYLLDTYDTIRSGIPAAFKLIREDPGRRDSIRYDSGDKEKQYRTAVELAKSQGIRPIMILEDGWDLGLTQRFEALRAEVGWKPEEQFYGYGGHLVAATAPGTLTRDRVAAVWKLSQTGGTPTMKFADDPNRGKESVPGRPVLWRRIQGGGPTGIIGQEGEAAPAGYEAWGSAPADPNYALEFSPETHALQTELRRPDDSRLLRSPQGGRALPRGSRADREGRPRPAAAGRGPHEEQNRGFEIPFASTGTLKLQNQSEDDREETRARRHSMGDDLAAANVNRSYSLAATSIAIFTFMLFFLYPRFASGEINALLFQATLVVMGVATFSFVFASFYYYCSSLGARIHDAERATYSRRGDRFWLVGYALLFLDPSLILFSIGLLAVGSVWFALWLVYLLLVIRYFPRVQTARMSS